MKAYGIYNTRKLIMGKRIFWAVYEVDNNVFFHFDDVSFWKISR